ncbi:hypothetical protein CGCF415_v011436 [Colletotrichum fructicola]|uniref:Uncharacterized protein n=1 Tax=Colletotrichum fructicola (strain Nara gc5) TaxID=1213859 RepID=A0A7J6IHA0_COLFN|nr:uncharacterized protein CGMCC3_g4988 [Colletotrichum fructicola]KAF4475355.1 hypothetical protein CGGC5_v015565 [Colletotrichum fructicola Nara gc5]KAE9578899.1 hypothetical protein CGMCC3_g4988 [Colletotrichum fructicola]KAF4411196.1 hypothetical protein CFRS1_v014712 [Colletotrichum fructicola]KAF4883748.1 hypothetical protein CGCFRS4_v013280 [Colletotrichum fructicola]KAF4896692.1 hypothetical protein CGCF415_v011436 [Colletotrichum fructicola]
MASRHPIPNTYHVPPKDQKPSSSSVSSAVKSFFTMPESYPAMPSTTSRYPLPTAYTKTKSRSPAQHGASTQGSSGPRASVESWDTIDKLKDNETSS